MDADGHGIVVGMVGFSMALMGFVMSLVAPVVHSIYPRFQQQLPAIILNQQARHRGRRRIASAQNASGQAGPSSDRRPSPSPSGSADSVATSKSSTTSSETNATSLLSDGKVSGENGRKEEHTGDAKPLVSATPCTPRACIARVARIGAKGKAKRTGSASTAVSSSSVEVAEARQPIARERMTDSPASSTLNLAARSSSELDVNYVLAPSTPTQDGLARKSSDRPRPLSRAKTFFNLGRSSSKRRQEASTYLSPSDPLHPPPIRASTLDDSRSSLSREPPHSSTTQQFPFPSDHTSSEASGSNNRARVDENGVILNGAAADVERSKSVTVACLGKLKGKKKSSSSLPSDALGTAKSQATETEQKKVVSEETSQRKSRPFCSRSRTERPTSLHIPSSDAPESPQPTPSLSKKHSKKSTSPPRRTRPYEAPYFFPMPTSPDAVDYARRTRSEYVRAYSGVSQERPSAATNHAPGKESPSKGIKEKSEMVTVTPERDLKAAPAHRVGFHFPLHFHRSHTRSASLTSPVSASRSLAGEDAQQQQQQAEADELGFVKPPQDARARGGLVPPPGIARSATLPGNDWPSSSGEDTPRPLRPALSPKGMSR